MSVLTLASDPQGATAPESAEAYHARLAEEAALCPTAHTMAEARLLIENRRQDWLRAGQALQHVLLTATARGVRTSPLHQAMEWPDLRSAMALPRHQRCHPQVLIRFGYGPDGGCTPRARGQAATRPAEPSVAPTETR